jgi:hypothetical protein
MAQPLYFSTPKESAEITSKLLIQEDWDTLMRYYYVTDSNEEIVDSLRNGSYFIRTEKPELIHPSVSWKYKKPFDPSFNYSGYFEESLNKVKVEVSLEIDQGNDMIQRGITTYYLIKSKNGFQFIP